MVDDILVGSTGFVGGNLAREHGFQLAVHSSDVVSAYGAHPDLCVYAGVPSAMFLANEDPEADLAIMGQARENLRRIAPEKPVLVSTIAVYPDSRGRNEDSAIDGGLAPYGANRLQLERWVREDFPNALIVRLPALYGPGLKKNFIRDMISIAPPLLRHEKYEELAGEAGIVACSYAPRDDGLYALRQDAPSRELREWFADQDLNALSFTDSRSRFQFYDLGRLWDDVVRALEGGWRTLNLATPPVAAADVYRFVRGREWRNHLPKPPFDYDMRTVHGADGTPYLCTLEEELRGIRSFVEAAS